jgi:hypothetical protein
MTPLVTIRGSTPGYPTVDQAQNNWLDLADYDDATFFLNVTEVTGTVTLTYQSAPLKDTMAMVAFSPFIPVTLGQRVDIFRARFTDPPISRFVRWQLFGDVGTWDVTFSIDVAVR